MHEEFIIEIIGYSDMECSPFPCNDERTCGLTTCAPTNQLGPAVNALHEALTQELGNHVQVLLTLIDKEVPDYIKKIYEEFHPALPIILINKKFVPVGRISYPRILEEIRKMNENET